MLIREKCPYTEQCDYYLTVCLTKYFSHCVHKAKIEEKIADDVFDIYFKPILEGLPNEKG